MMATPTFTKRAAPPTLKRRYILPVVGSVALIALAWLAYNYQSIKGQAELAAAYGAHIACSCRYIAGREIENCKRDFEPGMEMLNVVDDPENKRVIASIPFLAKAMAERRGAFGCIVLNDEEMSAVE
jgi:hypothetical protein